MSLHIGPIASPGAPRPDRSRNTPVVTFNRPPRTNRFSLRLALSRTVQLHRGWILAFSGIGLIAALIYLVAFWSSYKAQSLIAIDTTPAALAATGSSSPTTSDSLLQQQIALLHSSGVLEDAVRHLPSGVWRLRGESDQAAANRLRPTLTIAPAGSSGQIAIVASASDGETAAALADAVAHSYLQAAGSAHISARLLSSAMAPAHGVNTPVLRNSGVILMAFCCLGLFAALVAHGLDRRIYVAGDMESVIRTASMAQIPDFTEVTAEVADDHLMRLAAEIDFACGHGHLHNCIFTGTGPGAGTTTIARRVRDMLECMGRNTTLVDATGAVLQEPTFEDRLDRILELEWGIKAEDPALSAPASDAEAASSGPALVLTDAPSIAVSAETEALARSADCLVVIVASGETTREQLQRVFQQVQRIDPRNVGFVLNRLSLANAEPAFRRSIEESEQYRGFHGRPAASSGVNATRRVAELQQPAAPAAGAAQPTNELPRLRLVEPPQPAAEPALDAVSPASHNNWDPENMPTWLNDAMAKIEEAHFRGKRQPSTHEVRAERLQAAGKPAESAAPEAVEPIKPTLDPAPSNVAPSNTAIDAFLREQFPHLEFAAGDSEKSTGEIHPQPEPTNSILNPVEWIVGNPSKSDIATPQPPLADATQASSSRLGHLRSLVPPGGLRDLDDARANAVSDRAPQGTSGNRWAAGEGIQPTSGSRLSILRGLASGDHLKELQHARHRAPLNQIGVPPSSTPVNPSADALPVPSPQPHAPATSGLAAQPVPDSSLTGSPSGANQPDPLSAPEATGKLPLQIIAANKRLRNLPLDDVRILPARRGQYRKKD